MQSATKSSCRYAFRLLRFVVLCILSISMHYAVKAAPSLILSTIDICRLKAVPYIAFPCIASTSLARNEGSHAICHKAIM